MQVDCLHRYVPKKFLNLTPTPKIVPKGRKSAKRPEKCQKAPNLAKLKSKS